MSTTTVDTAVVGVLAFVSGLLVGYLLALLKGEFARVHTDRVSTDKADRPPRRLLTRRVGILIVSLALLANVATGFLNIANTRADQQRAACNERFNTRQQLALDERSARAVETTDREIELWRALGSELGGSGVPDVGALRVEIRDYVNTLERSRRSRAATPYPPPDLCRED